MAQISGLPAVSDAALPASVRSGTAADKQAYKAALGFEQLLVGQLVKSMAGDDGPLAQGPYADTMQASLTDAIAGAGGLGLAQSLYKEISDGSPGDAPGAIGQGAMLQGEVTR